jgi:hypothetical protein
MALATVVAIVVYRMSMLFSLRVYADQVDNSSAILFTTCTAACINLVCIVIFNWVRRHARFNLRLTFSPSRFTITWPST